MAQQAQARPVSLPVNLDAENSLQEGLSPAKITPSGGGVKARASGAGNSLRKYYLKDAVRDLQAQAAERTDKANRRLDKLIDLFGVYLKHKTGADVESSLEESEARHGKRAKQSAKNETNASKKPRRK